MRLRIRYVLAFCLLLAAMLAHAVKSKEPREPHDFRQYGMNCTSCHVSVGLKSRGILQKPVTQICEACHHMTGHSHPVDIDPALEVPADLPLDAKGMVTCATCHDPHKPRVNAMTGERTMFLRREGPREAFCLSCHRYGLFKK